MTDYIHTFDLTDRVTACIAYDDCFHDNVLRDMSHSDADESRDTAAVLVLGRDFAYSRLNDYIGIRDFAEFMDASARRAVDGAWEACGYEDAVIAAFEKNMERRGWAHKRFTLRGCCQGEYAEVVIAEKNPDVLQADADLLETCVFGPVYRIDYFIDGDFQEALGGVIVDAWDEDALRAEAETYAPAAPDLPEAPDLLAEIDAYGESCYVAGGIGGDAGRILADRALKRLLGVIGAPVPA